MENFQNVKENSPESEYDFLSEDPEVLDRQILKKPSFLCTRKADIKEKFESNDQILQDLDVISALKAGIAQWIDKGSEDMCNSDEKIAALVSEHISDTGCESPMPMSTTISNEVGKEELSDIIRTLNTLSPAVENVSNVGTPNNELSPIKTSCNNLNFDEESVNSITVLDTVVPEKQLFMHLEEEAKPADASEIHAENNLDAYDSENSVCFLEEVKSLPGSGKKSVPHVEKMHIDTKKDPDNSVCFVEEIRTQPCSGKLDSYRKKDIHSKGGSVERIESSAEYSSIPRGSYRRRKSFHVAKEERRGLYDQTKIVKVLRNKASYIKPRAPQTCQTLRFRRETPHFPEAENAENCNERKLKHRFQANKVKKHHKDCRLKKLYHSRHKNYKHKEESRSDYDLDYKATSSQYPDREYFDLQRIQHYEEKRKLLDQEGSHFEQDQWDPARKTSRRNSLCDRYSEYKYRKHHNHLTEDDEIASFRCEALLNTASKLSTSVLLQLIIPKLEKIRLETPEDVQIWDRLGNKILSLVMDAKLKHIVA